MSKKVNRWLMYGKKRCDKGDHWLVLDYGIYMVCPICGHKEKSVGMSELNCFLVTSPKLESAKDVPSVSGNIEPDSVLAGAAGGAG